MDHGSKILREQLKQLELDIESILSKRAKNPWMDTGYALLSYLLTRTY